jgi:hypothetical protein
MKFLSLSCFLLWWGVGAIQAQCSFDKYTQKGIKMLNQDHDGFVFLKSYEVDGAEGKKYSQILTQGTNYLIALSNNDVHCKGIYISIYDSNNNLVGTSLVNGKFYPSLLFQCKGTGVYQLKFGFEDTSEHCAAAVLGMKR